MVGAQKAYKSGKRLGKSEKYVQIIESVPLLSELSKSEVIKLAHRLKHEEFEAGAALMVQGERGDKFFIIKEGICEVEIKDKQDYKVLATLNKGDYCGEQALIYVNARRNATIRAKAQTECLTLDRANFLQIFKDSKVRFAKRGAKRVAIQSENLQCCTIDKSLITPKSPEQIQWLLSCVGKNELFVNYTEEQKCVLVECMILKHIKQSDVLINQGDDGNELYVIEEGTFDVFVDGILVTTIQRGICVGELALIYNAPRAATVKATKPGRVWYLHRVTFRKILMQHNQSETMRNIGFLKKVSLLSPLLKSELQLLGQALETRKFKKGEVIFNQGDEGEHFYIIKAGTVVGIKRTGKKKDEFCLQSGDFFGERALLKQEPRAATTTCKTDVVLMLLSRSEFGAVLGPLEDIMSRHTEEYDKSQIPNYKTLAKENKYPKLQQLKDNTKGLLGIGAFGTVTLVIDPEKKTSYALKAISKLQIVRINQEKQILNEKKVMQRLTTMFVVNLHRTYQDDWFLYLLLDACLGGELFTIHKKVGCFDEATSRFFVACVVEGFIHIHEHNVAYRDLKPENMVLDSEGYLRIADFGLSKFIDGNTFTMCGTPDYLAPEIITGKGHGMAVDWWALGVFIFELVASHAPFFALTMNDTFRRIIGGKIRFPKVFSPACKDIIVRLLQLRPNRRLGVLKGGSKLIRQHPWFRRFQWEQLRKKKMEVPIKSKVKGFDDLSNFTEPGDEVNQTYKFKSSDYDMSWAIEF